MRSIQRHLLVLLGGTLLIGTVLVSTVMDKGEPEPAPEREAALFGFVQPLPAPPSSRVSSGSAGDASPSVSLLPPEATNRMQAWRSIFERALAMRMEHPMEVLRGAVQNELQHRFGPEAVAAGMDLFDRYTRYQRESEPVLVRVDAANNETVLQDGFAALKNLRAQIFTPDETAFLFPHEEAYEQAMLARMGILADRGIGEEDRHARLQGWEAALPPEIRLVEELRTGVVRLPAQFAAPAEEPPEQ